jgi:hypothetical protein
MMRIPRLVLLIVAICVYASPGWTQCYTNCGVPVSPVVPICPPQIVPLSSCCERSLVFPPAPPIVAPIIVPQYHSHCNSVPVCYVRVPTYKPPARSYVKVRPKRNKIPPVSRHDGPRRVK